MNNIKNTVKKTIKEMDDIDIPSIERYLKQQGYTVLYIGTQEADEEILRYALKDYAENKKTFTYCGAAKFVFVQKESHPATKQLLLLHELGHILLKHIGANQGMYLETTQCEAEADTFAYSVIKGFRNKEKQKDLIFELTSGKVLLATVISFLIGISAGAILPNIQTKKELSAMHDNIDVYEYQITDSVQASADSPQTTSEENMVFVTETGNCFHRADCRYINENAKTIRKSIAEQYLRPCNICKP